MKPPWYLLVAASPASAMYSVIIPAYNAAGTLEMAIASAKAQNPPPREIVIGDDASTDGTAELGERLGAVVLRLPKGNGSIARNRAAEQATTDLLLFLDADDEWLPGKAAAHLEAWSNGDWSLVLDRSIRILPNGRESGANGLETAGTYGWEALIEQRSWSSGSGFSTTKRAYDAVGGFNEKLPGMQDVDFWIRCAHHNGEWCNLGAVLTRYIQYEVSVSKRKRDPNEVLAQLERSMPFLGPDHLKSLRETLWMKEALNARFPASLKAMAQAGWPVGDRRFVKYIAISVLRSLGLRKT